MKLNWNFQRVGGSNQKSLSVVGVWILIFLGQHNTESYSLYKVFEVVYMNFKCPKYEHI